MMISLSSRAMKSRIPHSSLKFLPPKDPLPKVVDLILRIAGISQFERLIGRCKVRQCLFVEDVAGVAGEKGVLPFLL
jgi:hypothetical protein